MKKIMMKYLMLNCNEATYLMSKKDEGKLNFIKRLQLFLHTSMCDFCRKFEKQSLDINSESKHINMDNLELSNDVKSRIKKMVDDLATSNAEPK